MQDVSKQPTNGQQLRIVVGSKNPVKVQAVANAFQAAWPQSDLDVQGVSAPSGVADQPLNGDETLTGARNRVVFCQQHFDADYYVAIEGGVDGFAYGAATFAYVVIAHDTRTVVGRSANLPLPASVFEALQQGAELGPLMDEMFGTTNVKQKGGAISLFTNGLESRQGAYEQAMIMALAPYLHPQLY
ncbi:inosine/xanthosine triphosphatase [Aestuariibacter halophilus]|uniref:Inosine/xanthosine triphosphatase n=1 Tax=Fluctibacter halophilus TaxID=226011 RepID=A0ABS8G7Q7_9ALTE|nr:inosine/xanthosine triphosphatase [Aestuariibacter halophilus]MCC2616565.1 inosine/xanthosine triphosphatase [Aestuariibacter halophilus]